MGLGGDVVTSLLKVVKDPSEHIIYFDNFFTSMTLLLELSKSGFYATGTIRDNRFGKAPLLSVKEMKKKDRGTYDTVFEKNEGVNLVRWNDNSVVTMASNWDEIKPLSYAKRYSRQEKKQINIPQPNMIANYNKNMGGVDLLDNFLSMYRIKMKSKKWWWPIFTNFIDVAKSNAWRIYRATIDSKMSLLDFQRNVAVSLLNACDEIAEKPFHLEAISSSQPAAGRPSTIQTAALNEVKKIKLGILFNEIQKIKEEGVNTVVVRLLLTVKSVTFLYILNVLKIFIKTNLNTFLIGLDQRCVFATFCIPLKNKFFFQY